MKDDDLTTEAVDLTARYCELRDEIAQALYDRDIADGTLHPLGLPPRSVIQWEVIHDLAMFALSNRSKNLRDFGGAE